MAVTRQMLQTELKDLLRLTAFEQTVATIRRAQARTMPIERELAENAKKAGERLELLKSAVATVGGVPDIVTPTVGRVGAFLQSQFNQVQSLQGALLGDLALEHQLRERTRYARILAQTLGEQQVLPVLDRLDVAHTATIEWLETRLGEVGRTGTSALRATPVQAVVTAWRRAAETPLTAAEASVNRVGGLLAKVTGRAPKPLQDALDAAVQRGEEAAREVSDRVIDLTQRGAAAARSAGRAAGSVEDEVEQVAGEVGQQVRESAGEVRDVAEKAGKQVAQTTEQAAEDVAKAAEQATQQALEATGGADVADEKPPFAGYDHLTGDSVMRHVADTGDVEELRTLLAYEQAHKARKGVVTAAQERLNELASVSS